MPPNQLNHALMFSITMREASITETLLNAGADMHAFDSWYPVLLTAIDIKANDIFEILIKNCKDINVSSNYGNILHSATRTGDINLVRRAFELGVDVNLQSKANQSSPLHEAVKSVKFNGKGILQGCGNFSFKKNKRKADHLEDDDTLDAKPDQSSGNRQQTSENTKKEDMDTSQKSEKGNYDLEVISFLISKNCNIDAKDIKGKTALHHACQLGNHEVVECLIKAGADPHIMDESNNIPVMYALNQHSNILVKRLIKEDSLNKPVAGSQYYVHMTSRCGSVRCLQYLINNGADLTVKDSNDHGNTALMIAICNGASKEYLRCLLSTDCAIDDTNTDNETAFSMLLSRYHSLKHPEEYVELMLQAGADINQVHVETGYTQLMTHATDEAITQCLLKQGADVNIVTKTGDNILLQACESGSSDIVKELFNHNLDLRLTELVKTEGNLSDMTPLKQSMLNSDFIELTELLLCAGASLRDLHVWVKESEHCKTMRSDCTRFDAVCKYIEATTRGPPKLSELCRISILKGLGPAPSETSFSELCLPASVKEELPWNVYLDIRLQELKSINSS